MSKKLDSILGRVTTATPRAAPVAETVEPADDARARQAALEAAVAAPEQARSTAAPKRHRKATPVPPSVASDAPATNVPEPAAPEPAAPEPAAPEPQRPVQAIVPVSIARALAVRAAVEDTTVRTLILQGLQAIGLDVPEAELRDRRR